MIRRTFDRLDHLFDRPLSVPFQRPMTKQTQTAAFTWASATSPSAEATRPISAIASYTFGYLHGSRQSSRMLVRPLAVGHDQGLRPHDGIARAGVSRMSSGRARELKMLGTLLAPMLAFLVVAPALADPAHPAPNRELERYKHTTWTSEDGVPSYIHALAQGADGYLWIGSEDGLFRFDGVTFERMHQLGGDPQRPAVSSLLVGRDGAVWVGYLEGRVSVLRNGKLRDARLPAGLGEITTLAQDDRGGIWALVGQKNHPLARLANGKWSVGTAELGLPDDFFIALSFDRSGTAWLTSMNHLYVMRRGADRFQVTTTAVKGRSLLTFDPTGRLWLTDGNGTRSLQGGDKSAFPAAPFGQGTPKGTFDADGGLWDTSGVGISRTQISRGFLLKPGAVERWTSADGLTSNRARALMIDKEGNVWVGTMLGLDRYRRTAIITDKRIPLDASGAVLFADRAGTVFVATLEDTFAIRSNGAPERLNRSLRGVFAMCDGPRNGTWFVSADHAELVSPGGTQILPMPPLTGVGIFECAVDRAGDLWLTAGMDGVFRRHGATWQHFPLALADAPHWPGSMGTDHAGRLLVAYRKDRLTRIDYPQRSTFGNDPGGQLANVSTIYRARNGMLLGGAFGLAKLGGDRLGAIPAAMLAGGDKIRGIVESPQNRTWVLNSALSAYPSDALSRSFDDGSRVTPTYRLGVSDGLPSPYNAGGRRDLVEGGDGRLWITTSDGIAWMDPSKLRRNARAPGVSIRSLVVDGRRMGDPGSVEIPPGSRSVEVDYAALSLGMPERVRFKYRLVGFDDTWIDPGSRRQAFYTKLPPGSYTFEVTAANEDGVWNTTGATLNLRMRPTFLQSVWLKLLCISVLLLVLWGAYQARVVMLTSRMRSRLEARLAERERIARELHDTLLQGFQGLILRFQSISNLVPAGQGVRSAIDSALDAADAALLEGRQKVIDIRASSSSVNLEEALTEHAEVAVEGHGIALRLSVEGEPRDLNPLVRDEVEKIAREAIRNAIQHSRAENLEIAIGYHPNELRLGIHDDGRGLSDDVVATGRRSGHFGLVGMRERSQRIGGEFNLSSRHGAGTEILVSVPASLAFRDHPQQQWFARLKSAFAPRRLARPRTHAQSAPT